MRPAAPETIADRYRLDAVLGRGGMGEVYRATDLRSGTVVAVKVMRANDEDVERAASRFIREARQTAALSHPNIVRALDFGRVGGILYLVIEHLEGESLGRVLKRETRLSPERAVHIGVQLCAALEAVHVAGIVHRDVKPANAMRVPTRADPDFMKLIDFGIARGDSEDTQLTGTGMMVGTTEYAAPEQILGEPLDGRADQYALGVMLYRLLAGVAPFEGPGASALVHQHLNVAPVPLTQRAPDAGIPPALDAVVLRCLAKRANGRHASMAELALALRRGLEGKPDDATVQAPVAHARLDQVEELELDTSNKSAGGSGGGLRRCAKCASDNSRFTTLCERCGADLGTPDQLAFMAGVLAQARAAAAPPTAEVRETRAAPTAASRPPPPVSAPRPAALEPPADPLPVMEPAWRGWLIQPLVAVSSEIYKRVLGYSVAALLIGQVFGLFSSTVSGVLL
ncbi:MAG: serine/threonine protein kinase, partial [Myxococcaceae bacterium]|nr:serine/threonine protein kinase [Myxococcaceae bacterium]